MQRRLLLNTLNTWQTMMQLHEVDSCEKPKDNINVGKVFQTSGTAYLIYVK